MKHTKVTFPITVLVFTKSTHKCLNRIGVEKGGFIASTSSVLEVLYPK